MEKKENPLAAFERLIGGEWHLEGSVQTFTWGVGKKTIQARSTYLTEDGPVPVGEGFWFWHYGENAIKGLSFAVGMPAELFDYTTRWEGDKMISDLVSYDSEGKPSEYLEEWHFSGEDSYEWALHAKTPDGLEKVMGGTFERK